MNKFHARTNSLTVRGYRRLRGNARSRVTKIVVIARRDELPRILDPRRIYQIGVKPKWALMDCPCGRGHTIELNLANPDRTRWTLSVDKTGQPSVRPSIDYQGQHRCHYVLRAGRIHWVRETRRRPR